MILDYSQKQMLKYMCERSYLQFAKYAFKYRDGSKFIVARHHKLMAKVFEMVVRGEIKRLIVNISPGYTKTELAVILFMSWGLALNPRCKFLHSSYSDDLAMLNSSGTKDIIRSEEFQSIWPQKLRIDSHAKRRWTNEYGGGVQAAPSKGGVTGLRGGRIEPGYSGAVIIDDPVKPADAYSDVLRNAINNRFNNTFRSRLATEDTPIIVIMQRIHEDDLTGFLLRGGSGDKWHHLSIPALIPEVAPDYPHDYTYGIPIEYDFPAGPVWETKHNKEQLLNLKKADPYTYSSQYDQQPSPIGGSMVRKDHWRYYDRYNHEINRLSIDDNSIIKLEYKNIYADTASKTADYNDYSVFQCWGKGEDGRIYLLDQVRGKWEAPDLRRKFLKFIDRHEFNQGNVGLGLRFRKVEDKSSGTGLIQDINRERGSGYITGIPRNKDKVSRMMGCLPQMSEGNVIIPRKAFWLNDYVDEFSKFTPVMSHKNDDQIDPTLDAIQEMLIEDTSFSYADVI